MDPDHSSSNQEDNKLSTIYFYHDFDMSHFADTKHPAYGKLPYFKTKVWAICSWPEYLFSLPIFWKHLLVRF